MIGEIPHCVWNDAAVMMSEEYADGFAARILPHFLTTNCRHFDRREKSRVWLRLRLSRTYPCRLKPAKIERTRHSLVLTCNIK